MRDLNAVLNDLRNSLPKVRCDQAEADGWHSIPEWAVMIGVSRQKAKTIFEEKVSDGAWEKKEMTPKTGGRPTPYYREKPKNA